MIVATAGHVDHGKTSLIRALTGIDTDRLPEERARGMTIDLGFAYLPLADGATIGFIDVPGHERFVRNMLAGVAGIDFALLVIAADDGPMPQTREHLAILELLGITRGAVALTKVDRVSAARVTEVTAEIAVMLAPTPLAAASIVQTAAPTGVGVEALRETLRAAQSEVQARVTNAPFRLAVDRNFVLEGAGRVVTGTVYTGAAKIGDRLLIAPAGIEVRVRSIHAQNQQAEVAQAGQRCGINLTGSELRRYEIKRGDWLIDPALHAPTTRLGVVLQLARGETQALRDRMPVHVHIGAADLGGRLSLLEARGNDPVLATLTLDAPTNALRGDRVVLRDQAATRTLAGGMVLEPLPYPRTITRAKRVPLLHALEHATAEAALRQLLTQAPEGIDATWFARCYTLPAVALDEIYAAAGAVTVAIVKSGESLVDAANWHALQDGLQEACRQFHTADPAQPALAEAELLKQVTARFAPRLARAALEALAQAGVLQRRGTGWALARFEPVLAPMDKALWVRVKPLLERAGLQAPALHDLQTPLKSSAQILKPFFERMAKLGYVQQVDKYRYYLPGLLRELAQQAAALAGSKSEGRFTAAEFRSHTGIGRNVAIEVLEYFDRAGFTHRIGDARRIRKAVHEVFGSE